MKRASRAFLAFAAFCLLLLVLNPGPRTAAASTYSDDITSYSFTYYDFRTEQRENFSLPCGKPVVVLYGGIGSCGNTNYFIRCLTSGNYDLSDFELFLFDIKENTVETVLGEVGSLDSRVHVSTADSVSGSSLYNMFRRNYVQGNTMPFVGFIDADGVLREFSEAAESQKKIDENMRSIGVSSSYTDPVFDLPLELRFCQTEARTEFEMINEFRTGDDAWVWDEDDSEKIWYTGLKALTYDYALEKVAMQRAAEIALYYSHSREDGYDCFQTYYDLGYSMSAAGENIAAGHTSARKVFTAWREDDEPYSGQGHRRNILSDDFRAVGVGCVFYNGYYYWTQEFSGANLQPEATAPDDSRKVVTVKASYRYMDQMTLDPSELQMDVNEHGPVTDFVKVMIANKYYSWSVQGALRPTMLVLPFQSSDESVLRYEDGQLIPVKAGTCELTAELYGGAFTFRLPVTVNGCKHEYRITYEWSADHSSVHAEALCQKCGDHISETAEAKFTEVPPTCEEHGYTAMIAVFSDPVFETQKVILDPDTAPATGHRWGTPVYQWSEDYSSVTAFAFCQNDPAHVIQETSQSVSQVVREPSCEEKGSTAYTAAFENSLFKTQKKTVEDIAPLGHDWAFDGLQWIGSDEEGYTACEWTFVCENDPSHVTTIRTEATAETEGTRTTYSAFCPFEGRTYTAKRTITTPTEPSRPPGPERPISGVARIFGSTRYQTSLRIADTLKEVLGVEKFNAIVLVSGQDFPDGLSASYLAAKLQAPILATDGSKKSRYDAANKYVLDNLAPDGTVYVIGGNAAIPEAAVAGLSGVNVERLSGSTRYLTNLAVLDRAGVPEGSEVLIATGTAFPDSLSVSSTGLPLFLVDGKKGTLNAKQKAYLAMLAEKGCSFTLVGGTGAINDALEKQIRECTGKAAGRVSGSTRYKTSAAIAERYFKNAEIMILGYGENFPDALSAGPLGAALNAPVVLTVSGRTAAVSSAQNYASAHAIRSGYVLGGAGLISDADVRMIFSLQGNAVIQVK